MTFFIHELKQNRLSLVIWSLAISFMLCVSIIIYPEMSGQMEEMNEMMSEMGAFSSAFGLDQLSFGEFSGYYGIECGNVLGLGGALFAAIVGICAIAKEEKDRTAEFLLTHPIKRSKILFCKLASVFTQILLLNIVVNVFANVCAFAIGEGDGIGGRLLLGLAYLLMQIEIASICFGISAFVVSGTYGIGIGLSLMLYFMNIIANLTEDAEFLKYITPFGFSDSAYIINENSLKLEYLLVGILFALIGISVAYIKYPRKDIK